MGFAFFAHLLLERDNVHKEKKQQRHGNSEDSPVFDTRIWSGVVETDELNHTLPFFLYLQITNHTYNLFFAAFDRG